jgi:hypothetical protein
MAAGIAPSCGGSWASMAANRQKEQTTDGLESLVYLTGRQTLFV